mmetsp:Transcript_63093/g.137163  ORF Transcript_63093/g.137163 Transcript_63093/m.137163 type:complete len:291 (+) Transcript_63093:259-1131(+)
MGCFSVRPAPLQIEFMGGHDTTGASYMDYFISDPIASTPELSPFYSEKLVYTPHSFFINEYKVSRGHILTAQRPSRKRAGLPDEGFVFANFNQLFKVDPATFSTWMRILKATPNSVLWLLRLPFGAEKHLREAARSHGVDDSRLIFTNRGNWSDHLAVKANADLAIDNPVFNSHTSGVDILWAGVPMLTLPSDKMSGRVAASLVALGVDSPEMVARNIEDYTAIALRLSSTGQHRLRTVRRTLEANRHRATLFDTARFARDLDRMFTALWDIHTQGSGGHHLVQQPQGSV